MAADDWWRVAVRRGTQALHAGDQRSRPRREGSRRDARSSSWTATARARGGRSTRCCPRSSIPTASTSSRTSGPSTRSFSKQGCDAALFVGMHARAGTPDGVMNHTISGRDYQNLWFNGTLVGETGINAALCGTWSCPVLLVTGDEASCREGKELLGDGLTTVPVKRGLGSESARMIPPARARELIEAGARQALVRPRRQSLRTTRAARARSRRSSRARPRPTGFASDPASSGSTSARSSLAATRGGRPGSGSTSEPAGIASSRSAALTRGLRTDLIVGHDDRGRALPDNNCAARPSYSYAIETRRRKRCR